MHPQEQFHAGEERAQWEKEISVTEVSALLLAQELQGRAESLRGLKEYTSACLSLRKQLSAADRASREANAARNESIFNLHDQFYAGHLSEVKQEIQSLQHQITEVRELEEDKNVVQSRIAGLTFQ